MLIWLFLITIIIAALNGHYNTLPMPLCHHCGGEVNSQQMKIGGYIVWKREGQKVRGVRLLYLTGGGGGCLATHAGRVDWFGQDQIQVLVVRDLVEAVPVLQQLDVQILIDLLSRGVSRWWVSRHIEIVIAVCVQRHQGLLIWALV